MSKAYIGMEDMLHSEEVVAKRAIVRSRSSSSSSSSSTSHGGKLDVEELEMLLEAYFVQIDGTLNKLSTVCLKLHSCSAAF